MHPGVAIAAGLALGVATIAAVFDSRNGEIPNWLTLPPIVLAPLAYGLVLGIDCAFHSLAAACLSALIPYFLFRRGGMGGGDVKLFGALGAITGFDLFVGVEIQATAFVIAMGFALAGLAWDGALWRTLVNVLGHAFSPLLPASRRRLASEALSSSVRMGTPILAATAIFAAPHLVLAWTGP